MKLNEEEWAEAFDSELGELFGNEFFRVILDEGHAIKNANSKSALSLPLPPSCSPKPTGGN